jgi:uncharacterized lipoprotein
LDLYPDGLKGVLNGNFFPNKVKFLRQYIFLKLNGFHIQSDWDTICKMTSEWSRGASAKQDVIVRLR